MSVNVLSLYCLKDNKMENRLRVGITHGDINGVAYELIIKMMAENRICEVCTPIFYGSPKVAAYYRKNLNVENFNLNNIQSATEANQKRCNVINCVDDNVKVEVGKETQESNEVAMSVLKRALDDLERKELDVVVAAPQSMRSFQLDGGNGCFDFFYKRYDTNSGIPLLVGEKMKMGFVTTHIPFKEIAENLTEEKIFNKLKTLDFCLRRDFTIRKPRIAILGLNPGSSERCEFDNEEKNAVLPAINKAREQGIMALGPYAADRLFSGTEFEKFDAILALYYDQGMIPFKTIEGVEGAVLIAGVPVVFTLPLNGPAYAIAGQGIANEQGLRKALYLAIDVYNTRMQNISLVDNSLPHYDVAGNANESDLNVEQITGIKEETV